MKSPSQKPTRPARQPLWFLGLLVLLALIPLPFGANRPWASDLIGLYAGILLALLAFDFRRKPSLWPPLLLNGAPFYALAFSALSITIVILWGWMQTWGLFPPYPLWNSASAILGAPIHDSLSLTPDRFGECALRILTYVACFLLAFLGCRDDRRAKLLLHTIAYTAVAYAFYGLLIQSSGLNIVLWYQKWAYQNYLTSTFINRNSYATYAGLGLLSCLAMFWRHFKKRPALKMSVVFLEKISARDFILIAMILAVFGALILTGSRGGISATFIGCISFLSALAVNREWKGKKWFILFLPVAALVIGFSSFNADLLLDRIDPKVVEDNSMLRINAYETIFRALDDNGWQGFGLGSFENAFHLYRNVDVQEWFEHAHNDYLELSMELGIPVTLVYLLGITAMIGCCVRGVMTRRKHEVYCILAVGASVLVATHSLVDFSMEIPAVAATYAAILGLGVAQSWSSRSISGEE